jgi:glycosyltransferase involved in cell wall biosynthesis
MIRVSVIVPAYNESATIIPILKEVAAQSVEGCAFEVIVIDDGSKDDTVALLEANPGLYTRLIKQARNGGKGAAVLAGLNAATGDYILFQDADLEYTPSEYAVLLYPVLHFGAEIVMGSRFMAPKYTRVQYYSHKLGNKFITFMFNLFYNLSFTDIYSCYLMYKKSLVDPQTLRTRGWEQHAEILSRAVAKARVIYEVPISYHGRSYEEGKKIRWYHAWSVVRTIIGMRLLGR